MIEGERAFRIWGLGLGFRVWGSEFCSQQGAELMGFRALGLSFLKRSWMFAWGFEGASG